MCTNCFGWQRDYHYQLLSMDRDTYAEAMTDKEKNDLKLFNDIRINEKILRDKVELRRIKAMKKEYDI